MKPRTDPVASATPGSALPAQDPDKSKPPPVDRLASGVFGWEKLVAVPTKKGQRRDPFDAPTVTLDRFHCHITTLNPGEDTGAPHRQPQEELVILKEGTLEINIDGQLQTATAGSMIFYAANELENMRNVGTTPATYYVLQFFTPLTAKS
jgi:XRE family transcriptional regulator, regulator of sulfur utilization